MVVQGVAVEGWGAEVDSERAEERQKLRGGRQG